MEEYLLWLLNWYHLVLQSRWFWVVLTGAGDKAFCSGGDQNVKGKGGYIGKDGIPRLNVLDVQKH